MTDMRTQIIGLEQGKPEWLAWRRTRLMASEAAVVMECAPSWMEVQTRDQLRKVKENNAAPEPSEFISALWEGAHAMEKAVRGHYNTEGGFTFRPVCIEGEANGVPYGASLDGYDEHTAHWLEVKAPRDIGSSTYVMARARESDPRKRIPAHIWWQMVHQAALLPEGWQCIYVVAPQDGGYRVEILIPGWQLRFDWERLNRAWEAYYEHGGPPVPLEHDRYLVTRYVEAQRDEQRAKERLDEARAALLAAGPREIERYATITEGVFKGRVDWKAYAKARGATDEGAEIYRKPPTTTRLKIKLHESAL